MAANGRSVYLHFLDRELGESVKNTVSSKDAKVALLLLSLLSESAFNCGASLIFESPAINESPSLLRLVMLLIESGHLTILSSHPTLDEFIESRAHLYSHDRPRYPMYFGTKISLPSKISILPKKSSATKSLSRSLLVWGLETEGASDREIDAKRVVTDSLARREERAVTAALFSSAGAQSAHPEIATGIVRRQISIDYTKHFMQTLDSDIPTGMRGIEYFDRCSTDFPQHDIGVLYALAKAMGAQALAEDEWTTNSNFWEDTLHGRGADDELGNFRTELEIFKASLSHLYKPDGDYSRERFRLQIAQILERVRSHLNPGEIKPGRRISSDLKKRILNVIGILENNPQFSAAINQARIDQTMNNKYKFLLMVATETERQSVLAKAREVGCQIKPIFAGGRGYYDLGSINGNRIALVKAEMGSGSVGGSITTTMRMVDQLKPTYIIMVGIAFGSDEKKQAIGTILLGRQLLAYEQQRIGTSESGGATIIPRGDRTSASPTLVSLLQTASGVWTQTAIEVGLLLSGEKLVDNVDFRDQLKAITGGEAIGGEMEGGGLMVAAAESRTHWIVVKAICDWADGNKSEAKKERQQLAADNAAAFVFAALQIAHADMEEN